MQGFRRRPSSLWLVEWRHWRVSLLLVTGVYAIGLFTWLMADPLDSTRLATVMVLRAPLMALTAMLGGLLALQADLHQSTRRFWRWFGAAYAIFAVVELVPVWADIRLSIVGPSLQALLYAGGMVLIVPQTIRYLWQLSRRPDYRFVFLDVALIGIVVGLPLIALFLGDTRLAEGGSEALWLRAFLLLMVLILTLQALGVAVHQRLARSSWVPLCAGLAAGGELIDLSEIHLLLLSPWAHPALLKAGVLLVSIWLMIGATLVQRLPGTDPLLAPIQPVRSVVTPLPFIMLIVVQLLLVVMVADHWSRTEALLMVGSLAITVLVIIRQLLHVGHDHRRLLDATTQLSQDRFRALVQHAADAIAIVSPSGHIRELTPAARRVFGQPPATLQGRWLADLAAPEDGPRLSAMLRQVAAEPRGMRVLEWSLALPPGTRRVVSTCTNLLDEPAIRGLVVTSRDVTEQAVLAAQLDYRSGHDDLTGLANRPVFLERAGQALRQKRPGSGAPSIIVIDLAGFLMINERYGHAAGDTLLTVVAQRLLAAVPPEATVARLNGDEFAVLLPESGGEAAQVLANRLIEQLAAPIMLDGTPVTLRAHAGVAQALAGRGASTLLAAAGGALSLAKRAAVRPVMSFDADAQRQLGLRAALGSALEQGQFRLHYQPIVELASGRVVAVEALVRWQHPHYGLVSPQEFIGLAEQSGQVIGLGRWVLGEACRQLGAWQAEWPAARGMRMHVNVSGHQLLHPQLLDEVVVSLYKQAVDPSELVLEITESVMVGQDEAVRERLQALKALGIGLAVDDFGTGYSNLSLLHQLPIDTLKLDRSFVGRLGQDPGVATLLRTIHGLAQSLQLGLVMEGIEGGDQRELVMDLGYQLGQGYLFATPHPADELGHLFH